MSKLEIKKPEIDFINEKGYLVLHDLKVPVSCTMGQQFIITGGIPPTIREGQ